MSVQDLSLQNASVDAGTAEARLRRNFWLVWAALLAIKLVLAARLPAFVDEAFYAWEARHLAWAYSDLPGLTAWLISIGRGVGGESLLALRAPFLLLAALMPLQVVALARRWFGAGAGWRAGLLAMALPLTAVSGVLALPDVPLLFAALLCVDAIAALQLRLSARSALQLALGLSVGAFSHYRYAAIILAGGLGLLMSRPGRELLRSLWVWAAIALGALAWLPLLLWNAQHQSAGLSFQLVERHPWRFHVDGGWWPLVQAALLTPGLLILLVATLGLLWQRWRRDPAGPWGLLLGAGALASVGFWPLAFFVDAKRLSLHWPHAGWLLLVVAAPLVWATWRPWAQRLTIALAALGVAVSLGYLGLVAHPHGRARLLATPVYPENFAGWSELAAQVHAERRREPQTLVLAGDFKVGAELALALKLDDQQLAVLANPANNKHGRAAQLRLWGVEWQGPLVSTSRPLLLVLDISELPRAEQAINWGEACPILKSRDDLPELSIDRGGKRFLLLRLTPGSPATCEPLGD